MMIKENVFQVEIELHYDDNDLLNVMVENVFVFNSFEELYKNLPLLECGCTENDVSMASPDDMEQYYLLKR